MTNKINAWAIQRSNGDIILSSIAETKILCIGGFLGVHRNFGAPFEEWMEHGFSCVRVKIKEDRERS